MPDSPTAPDFSGMQTITLRDLHALRELIEKSLAYIERIEAERWAAHANVHALLSAALNKQEEVQAVRNAAQNEWRDSMSDLTDQFAQKMWVESQIENSVQARAAMSERIGLLEAVNIRDIARSDEDRRMINELSGSTKSVSQMVAALNEALSKRISELEAVNLREKTIADERRETDKLGEAARLSSLSRQQWVIGIGIGIAIFVLTQLSRFLIP